MSRRPNDPRSPTPENIERAQQAEKILEMRGAGMTRQQVAERLGVSVNTVDARVKRAIRDLPKANAQEYVLIQSEQLDNMFARAAQLMGHSNPHVALKAIQTMVSVQERKAKLLGADHAEMRALEEARRDLEMEQGQAVFAAIQRITARLNLTPDQQAALPAIAREEFKRIMAEEPKEIIQGEIQETEDDQ